MFLCGRPPNTPVVGIFDNHIRVYETNNVGCPYDFGFYVPMLGVWKIVTHKTFAHGRLVYEWIPEVLRVCARCCVEARFHFTKRFAAYREKLVYLTMRQKCRIFKIINKVA